MYAQMREFTSIHICIYAYTCIHMVLSEKDILFLKRAIKVIWDGWEGGMAKRNHRIKKYNLKIKQTIKEDAMRRYV